MEYKLQEVFDIHNSKRIPLSKMERNKQVNKSFPYYGAQGIIDYVEDFLFNGEYLLVAEDGENLKTRNENIAQVANGKFWVNNHAHILSVKENFNTYYLLNKLNSMDISGYLTGTVQPKLSRRNLEQIRLNLPDKNTQDKIGNFILKLSNKLQVNQKIIANLEELSQTLFKRWFVDFEFPDKNGNPYKSSGGEMIDSELGEIPLSWEIQKLNDIFKINYGKNLPIKKILNTGYPVFGGNGIIGYYSSYMYETPKILISCRGAASGKIHISKEKSFVTNNSIVLDEKKKNYFYYFKELYKYNDFKRYSTGSAQPQITIANIKDLIYLTPDTNIIDLFNSKVSCLFNKKNNCEDENQKLIQLRDTLLPKLMSGEIEIPDDIEVMEDELSI